MDENRFNEQHATESHLSTIDIILDTDKNVQDKIMLMFENKIVNFVISKCLTLKSLKPENQILQTPI